MYLWGSRAVNRNSFPSIHVVDTLIGKEPTFLNGKRAIGKQASLHKYTPTSISRNYRRTVADINCVSARRLWFLVVSAELRQHT